MSDHALKLQDIKHMSDNGKTFTYCFCTLRNIHVRIDYTKKIQISNLLKKQYSSRPNMVETTRIPQYWCLSTLDVTFGGFTCAISSCTDQERVACVNMYKILSVSKYNSTSCCEDLKVCGAVVTLVTK